MIQRALLLAIAALALTALCAPALAFTCNTIDEYDAAIAAAGTCASAHAILDKCQFGSTADISPAATVSKQCEALFLDKASRPVRAAYSRALANCDRRFAHLDGTMYLSANATCHADAAYNFARKR